MCRKQIKGWAEDSVCKRTWQKRMTQYEFESLASKKKLDMNEHITPALQRGKLVDLNISVNIQLSRKKKTYLKTIRYFNKDRKSCYCLHMHALSIKNLWTCITNIYPKNAYNMQITHTTHIQMKGKYKNVN